MLELNDIEKYIKLREKERRTERTGNIFDQYMVTSLSRRIAWKSLPVVLAADLVPKIEPMTTAPMKITVRRPSGRMNRFLRYQGDLEETREEPCRKLS